ncbi:MAG: glycerol dehydratase reactivase beta/small subunit family protein [Firmicutes bacterium]|nr:glycerol dehydratase reactivase beta/small subunit family protein [Bacillota bacterium]
MGVAADPAAAAGGILGEVLAGLEEEGVPWEVEVAGGEPVALAHRAAARSGLRVGLAVTAEGTVVLHHAQLPPGRPIQHVPGADHPARARLAGRNAGRLAKGLPLEGLSAPGGTGSGAPDRTDPAAVVGVVLEVLRRLGVLGG